MAHERLPKEYADKVLEAIAELTLATTDYMHADRRGDDHLAPTNKYDHLVYWLYRADYVHTQLPPNERIAFLGHAILNGERATRGEPRLPGIWDVRLDEDMLTPDELLATPTLQVFFEQDTPPSL